ncbi:MAG: CoA pyrophosphatase [Dehalococcoidales bacterium]|nr:CoA pyrophosphatase [Dehalococcoidales bacterium]
MLLLNVKEKLKQALFSRQKRRIFATNNVPAAVILPIYYKEVEPYILFTKRTEEVKTHKGQISFPGGVYQEGDGSLVSTALRECAEEIGLTAENVEILGELDDILATGSDYIVSPFVGFIPWPYKFEVDQRETEKIIEIPVSVLLDKNYIREETRNIDGNAVTLHFYTYQETVVWGLTARILNQFLDIFKQMMANGRG